MEEAKRIVGSVDAATSSWLTPIFDFLTRGGLTKDQKLKNEIKAKVGRYVIKDNKLYKRTTFKHGLLCIANEGSDRVMFEAHEGEYGSHTSRRRLS